MIAADRDRCCGSGMCVLIDPSVFAQDDSGLVVVDTEAAGRTDTALLRHACTCCPGLALTMTVSTDSDGA